MQLGKPRRRLHVTARPSVLAGPGRSVDPVDGRVATAPDDADTTSPSSAAAAEGGTPDPDRRVDVR